MSQPLFVDQIGVIQNQQVFRIVGFSTVSGQKQVIAHLVMVPKLAKEIHKLLGQQIEEHEKRNGKIGDPLIAVPDIKLGDLQ